MFASRKLSLATIVQVAEEALVFAFDTLVVILTFYKTYQLAMMARKAGIHQTLSGTILRDGE